jgi:D-3-phosphoglycerate dehydrogenase
MRKADQELKKILITEPLPLIEEEMKILEKYADVKIAGNTSEDYLVIEVDDVDLIMVVYAKITKRIIESAKKLKGIVRYGIGVDNIDLESANERKIPIANVPDYCIGSVADHAFALLLALNRKILIADKMFRSGMCTKMWTNPPENFKGLDLEGKTLGIIGFGKIGRALAKRAKGFGMKVIAYDPYITSNIVSKYKVKPIDLDTLLKESDFVSIHVPLTHETRGMIGERQLKLMRKTAYLINVARGSIVDEKALYRALKDGWIAGAGLDVYEKEPPDPVNPLFSLENVVLSPHIAWYTEEALRRLEMTAVNEAIRILKGHLPKNLVNKEAILCLKK